MLNSILLHEYKEVEKDFIRLHNVLEVQKCLQTYGRSPELVELIGNENLEGLNFKIGAVWDDLSHRLKNLSRSMAKQLAGIVSKGKKKFIRNPPYQHREVTVAYQWNKLKSLLTMNPITVDTGKPIGELTERELKNVLNFKSQKVVEWFGESTKSESVSEKWNTRKVLEKVEAINSANTVRALGLSWLPFILEKLSEGRVHSTHSYLLRAQELLKIQVMPSITIVNQPTRKGDTEFVIKGLSLPQSLHYLTDIAMFLYDLGCSQYRALAKVEIELIKLCYNQQQLIHLAIPVPIGVSRELGKFFGGGLSLRNCIISNMYGKFAKANAEARSYGGYAMPEREHHVGGVPDVWINPNVVDSALRRAELNGALTKRDALLQIFVHEAKHVFDGQHGRIGKVINANENPAAKHNSPYERDARAAQRNYRWTPAMQQWIASVLRQLAEAYRMREKFKRDNAAVVSELFEFEKRAKLRRLHEKLQTLGA